ncbi:MAG: nuclear transport factor 2 family protein [Ignavibacteriaceae bacterium]|jgi:hypothetical protein|nr:nuclear transport factor 2 family protein [Ignavibacteriaceae bacterium]MCW8812283.1 nuclear transport factor 2 family protein [Chlorobium sp.]MCW8996869.1 nuclear transport factor 2 family protein [Psychromonas sp.]MCW8824341.1 nuclear transport factor 2 family protein [Ignavibacteriaceae bacterium]MCW8961140.1 nuclear transport factor 2 family protein [Ignavibacteriaceae bacterium]
MYKYLFAATLIYLLGGCKSIDVNKEMEYRTTAEKFIRGEYGCSPEVVDEFADDSIFVSYPVFQKLFNTPAIRGRDSVKHFAEGFCKRWKDGKITIHSSVVEGNQVVFIWSFRAISVGSVLPDADSANQEESWGGITLFRFNKDGKIIAEIGEESTPGPFARSTFESK